MEPVGAFLDVCRLARKQTHRNLTVFALLGEQFFEPTYLLLETALEKGLVEIRELGPEGSVPELRLLNRAGRPVLIVEGEELVGAKQNRVVNVTILVAAGGELVKSYALDAIDAGAEAKATPSDQARRFLASAAKAKTESHRSVGLGENLTLESRIAAGAALVHEDRVVHLSAFRKTGRQKPGGRVGFQRYSSRRQRSFE
jgi:hypothetical protein